MTRKILAAALLALGTGGCNFWYNEVPSPDDLMHNVAWFDHMILSKAVHPYQRTDIPRNTPAGIVPVGGGEADWRVGDPRTLAYGFDVAVADKVTRDGVVARPDSRGGEELYITYCAMCHGDKGAQGGTVTSYIGAPSLLTDRARGYTDGYLYSIIRYGRGLMGQYGDKIVRQDERWAVVDYVRQLQANAPMTAATGGQN